MSQVWPKYSFMGLLPPRDREHLVRRGRRQDHPAGSYLVRQGRPGQDVFVILTGRVQILIAGLHGPQQQIATRHRGDLVGEISYLDTLPRSASALAADPVASLYLPRETFDRYLHGTPVAYQVLARLLAERLRDSEKRYVSSCGDVDRRVVIALCNYSGTEDPSGPRAVRVSATQAQIARQIGASTASVQRALRKLAGRGIVETRHRAILVTDRDALAEIAGL